MYINSIQSADFQIVTYELWLKYIIIIFLFLYFTIAYFAA